MVELGVNIDHVATIRQARRTYEPDPVSAVTLAELGGADCITIHLREDRRHIQDRDVRMIRQMIGVRMNLELAGVSQIVDFACEMKPDQATLVPEKREEVTTEGGLDLKANSAYIAEHVARLQASGIFVSLFLDPEPEQIDIAAHISADAVELHTGQYALARGDQKRTELSRLVHAGHMIVQRGMRLHAGHGLNYQNVTPIAAIAQMRELNIGHAIIARALFVGLKDAVAEMKRLLKPFGHVKDI